MLHLVGILLTLNYDARNHELKMYAILIVLPLQQWVHERAWMLLYTHSLSLLNYFRTILAKDATQILRKYPEWNIGENLEDWRQDWANTLLQYA